MEAVRRMMPDAEIYVCKEHQRVTAFIGLIDDYIAGIFVEEGKQSKGLGKILLNHVKQIKEHLTLHVYKKNERAVKFYLREGFQMGREQVDENTGEAELLMTWEKE